MRLYIVRHGEALNRGGAERSLTPRGEADIDRAGRLLAEQSVDGLFFSPKLRTRQTAARILDAVGDVPAEPEPSLLPPASWRRIAEVVEAAGVGGSSRLVLVSHLPLVAELVGWFTSGDPGDYRLPGFPSGGIVTVDMDIVERGMGRLAWYAFPPLYRIER